jgi:hypothetical protein
MNDQSQAMRQLLLTKARRVREQLESERTRSASESRSGASDSAHGARTKSRHTPGPWIAGIDPGITTVDGGKVKIFASQHSFYAVLDGVNDYSQQVANGRLIAAAPSMLEAMQAALGRLKTSQRYGPDMKSSSDLCVSDAVALLTEAIELAGSRRE